MVPLLLLAVAAVVVVVGVAFVYWPAAIIVAGLLLGFVALLFVDTDKLTKGGKP